MDNEPIMKNLQNLCLLLCLLIDIPVAQAQIMPDSTVQICAYWTPGDKYAYRMRKENFKVNEKGDTTVVHRISELRTFEVLSQTKDRYRVQITYGEYKTDEKNEQIVNDAVVAATGPRIVEFETDETGSFIDITNADALTAKAQASVKPATEALWKRMSAEERKVMRKNKFERLMTRRFSDSPALIETLKNDIKRILFFHGMRFDSAEVYYFKEFFPPIKGGRDSLTGQTRFWVNSKLTDTYSALCNSYGTADATWAATQILMASDDPKGPSQKRRDSIAAKMKGMRVLMEQYSSEEIHLDTGWPLHLLFERTLTLSNDESKTKAVSGSRSTLDIVIGEK